MTDDPRRDEQHRAASGNAEGSSGLVCARRVVDVKAWHRIVFEHCSKGRRVVDVPQLPIIRRAVFDGRKQPARLIWSFPLRPRRNQKRGSRGIVDAQRISRSTKRAGLRRSPRLLLQISDAAAAQSRALGKLLLAEPAAAR